MRLRSRVSGFILATLFSVVVNDHSWAANGAGAANARCETWFQSLAPKPASSIETFDLGTAVRTSQVRELGFSEFTEARELQRFPEAPGIGYYKVYKAKHRNEDVFIKVSMIKKGAARGGMRRFEHFENEVAWTRRLDDLGIGPKFFGVSDVEGHHTIVTGFIEGVHLDGPLSKIPESFVPTPHLLESLKKIRDVLHREGIDAHDLQLRVTPDRAYIIDPEFFLSAKGPEAFKRPDEELDFYIREFEKRLKTP